MNSRGLQSARVSLAESVARELESEITGGSLEPGQRLGTKEDLRARFDVSLATINEAVKLLETRAMVTPRPGPGGGVFVTSAHARVRMNHFVMGYRWNEATVADHHAVRNALEPLVCREAAEYHSDRDIRVLRRMLDAMEKHVEEPLEYLRQTWALHRRIAKVCRNFALHSIYLTVIDWLEDGTERAEIEQFEAMRHLSVHRELVEAIDAGPGKRLEAAIAAHEVHTG
jgi:GntR family transcriptional repressor for pyruvate dehydrogenase complex